MQSELEGENRPQEEQSRPPGAAEADICLGWQLRRTGRSEGPHPEAGQADTVSMLPLCEGGLV